MDERSQTKSAVREQFGANAAAYVGSTTHAEGESLGRVLELVAPRPSWQALDVATGAGHMAASLAPLVKSVVALDLTVEMLKQAAGVFRSRGLTNVDLLVGDVDDLPIPDAQFDLVTCRIAPHHFEDIPCFVVEAARVVRPGGLVVIVDNVVPGSRLRGKKAGRIRQAGAYVNTFEKLRDPSHVRCLSFDEWLEAFAAAGLVVEAAETIDKRVHFEFWAARHDERRRQQLRAMLLQAPELAAEFLRPRINGDMTYFWLQEGLFVTRRVV